MVDDGNQRIRSLALQIDTLSAELRDLLLVAAPPTPIPVPPAPSPTSRFSVGSRVQILNTYKGLLHHQGIVTKVGSVFVWFKLDSTGQIVFRRHKNLRVLSTSQQVLWLALLLYPTWLRF